MAKPPMNGRPLLWGSWAGNALLTLLAAYVAFTHTGPLLPGTVLTIAVCILSGNLLPLGAHALLYSWDQLSVRAEQAQAGETLRKAIVRLGQAETRLAEARDASAKATLLARQIPDRIEEQFRAIAQSLQNFDTEAVADLDRDVRRSVEAIAEATARLEEAARTAPVESIKEESGDGGGEAFLAALAALQSTVDNLSGDIAALRGELRTASASRKEPADGPAPAQMPAEISSTEKDTYGDDPDWSVDITGTVDFSDEDNDPFDGIEDELRANGEPTSAEDESVESAPAEDPEIPRPDALSDETKAPAPDSPAPEPAADGIPPAPEPSRDKAAKKASKKSVSPKKKAKKAKPAKKDGDRNVELFPPADVESSEPSPGGDTILEAHAMIGIYNKLYLRGDPPLLDWDKGIPLDLTGIGEYRWRSADLKKPVACKLLLNDERWAIGENLVLRPGQTLVTHPKF